MSPLWLKALHLIFMVTWFAGLFYLPRLFIYHAEADDAVSRTRFQIMEKKLFVMMCIGAVLTLTFGIWMLLTPAYAAVVSQTWFQIKLLLLAGLILFHFLCWRWIQRLASGYQSKNTSGLRWFNEVPVFFLFAIIILAVIRPI